MSANTSRPEYTSKSHVAPEKSNLKKKWYIINIMRNSLVKQNKSLHAYNADTKLPSCKLTSFNAALSGAERCLRFEAAFPFPLP